LLGAITESDLFFAAAQENFSHSIKNIFSYEPSPFNIRCCLYRVGPLNGVLPTIPSGILDFARAFGRFDGVFQAKV
jgi:hypothetical protein